MKRSMLLGFCVLWTLHSGLAAQESLTLEQAVRVALEQSPLLAAARQAEQQAEGRALQARALSDPALTFSREGLALRKNDDPGAESEISLGLEQSFEFPGKRRLRAALLRFDQELASLEQQRLLRVIAARVKKAYYRVKLSEATIAHLAQSSKLLDGFLENLMIQYRAGTAAYRDILRTRVEKARLTNQALEEKRTARANAAELNLLLGRTADEALNLLTELTYVPFEIDPAALQETLRQTSPSLKMASIRLEQAKAGLRLARMTPLPDFSVGLFLPSLRAGAWGFGFGVSLPVWSWKTQRGQILEASATENIQAISLEAEARRFAASLENALDAVRTAEEQVRLFEQKLLREAEDELRLGMDYYRLGQMDFLNLLDLFRTSAAARLEHGRALYLYLASRADLEAAGEDPGDMDR